MTSARSRAARRARSPVPWLAAVLIGVLAMLVAAPLVGLVTRTLDADGTWADVLASPLSTNLLWRPLRNSLILGLGTGVVSTIVGAFLAWVVIVSDVPGKRVIGVLATVPFALPSFAIALAWESVFRNERLGGQTGLLESLGIGVPDALSWGMIPSVQVLAAHYYSLSFLIVSAALLGVGGDVVAAAELTGASRLRVALRILLPAVSPAVLSGFLLAFAEGISNFAVPALLGLPVRFQTLSTRLFGAISTGDAERGYALSIVLVVVAGLVLWAGNRTTAGRSFATITGKPSGIRVVRTGAWRWPLFAAAALITGATAIAPGVILLASTFLRRTNSLDGGFTLHFWWGESDASIAQGLRGVLCDPVILGATGSTVLLGVAVALGASAIGLISAWVARRLVRPRAVGAAIGFLSFVPFLIPGVAFGAAFIALFGAPIGPLPSLYGTFTILVLAGIAASLPFAFQTSRAALGQVSGELEEAAVLTGAGGPRRFARITAPLASRGVTGGAVLVFVTMVRDLSLVVLLVTPATPLLATLTYRYASEGFTQHANAVTCVIAAISVATTLLARRLTRDDTTGTTR